jgi:hypothetical protein
MVYGIPVRLNTGCSSTKENITVSCGAMQSGRSLPMFWRNLLPQSSGQRSIIKEEEEEEVCSSKTLVTVYYSEHHYI